VLGLRGERLFDGERLVDRPVVLLDGERIVAVGEALPESVPVVDLPGTTLLPGLFDCHQHLCFDGSGTLQEQVEGVSDDDLRARARRAAERALAVGVTTVRDVGDRDYLTLELRDDPSLPTILAAGPPITREQGHCWYLGGECEHDEAALRRAVTDRAERGCDLVKVMATGGALTPTFPMWEAQFSTVAMQAIADEAHRHGLPVAAHCHGTIGIERALDVGVDTIEHCSFFTATGSEPDADVMARIAASDVVVCVDAGRLPGAVPPPVIAANLAIVRGAHRTMHEDGATLIFGSDAGIAPGKPHDVLPAGIGELVEYGMPMLDVLRGSTAVAATSVGLGARKGRLAPGYDADLLAVTGDPLRDPAALAATAAVWKAGVQVR
jgi:imidazolonepropionase-like amidohydrolase